MIFREANVDDIPALSKVRLSVKENVLSNPYRITHETYNEYLSDIGKGWVCELQGQVLGFSVASLKDNSIWALFVMPGYEGKGIGKRLLNLATEWLFDMGAPSIILSTTVGTRADGWYERQGWSRGEVKTDGEVQYRLFNQRRA